jgi:hypothetical protein
MWDGIKDAFRSAINWLIDKWNGLHLTLPSVDTHIPGIGKIGGFTLEPPQIPRLALGAYFPPTPGGSLGILGEAGQAEFAVPKDRLQAMINQASGTGQIEIHNHLYLDATELRNVVIRTTQRTKLRNGSSLVTGTSHRHLWEPGPSSSPLYWRRSPGSPPGYRRPRKRRTPPWIRNS